MKRVKKKRIVVAVSGGMDPIHVGHVRLFEAAKKLGSELVVILNNDNWLRKKKGKVFMRQDERKEIVQALRAVDRVIYTFHPHNPKDMSVSKELLRLKPDIFANGGDRKEGKIPSGEEVACRKIKCRMVFRVGRGGKVQSSSWLLGKYATAVNGKGS